MQTVLGALNMKFSVSLPPRIRAQVHLNELTHFIGVTGPSGAGKSSLLRALAGVEPSAEVSAEWGMHSAKVGIVFQQPMLFPHVDVRGNFSLASRHAKANAMSLEEAVKGCCCEHLLDRAVSTLSGGEAQRVAIARALVNGPDVLLLDESLSAIDVATRRKIYRFLKASCSKRSMKCVVISHDLEDLALFSDEMLHIVDGEVTSNGEVGAVLQQIFSEGDIEVPSALITGVLSERDRSGNIAQVSVANEKLFVCLDSLAVERDIDGIELAKFTVKACDVSIDTNVQLINETSTSSILNTLPCSITAVDTFVDQNNSNKAKVLLTLQIEEGGGATHNPQLLYASVSALSVERLALREGMPVLARFKLS